MKWLPRLFGAGVAVLWALVLPEFVIEAGRNLSAFAECNRVVADFALELQCLRPEPFDRLLSSWGFGFVYFANVLGVIYLYERMRRAR